MLPSTGRRARATTARATDRWTAKDADLEPSLGATAAVNQSGWAKGGYEDREQEHDGREPDCEDEGAQCDDEGARSGDEEPWLGAPEGSQHYASNSDDLELDCSTLDPDDDPREFVARCEAGLAR